MEYKTTEINKRLLKLEFDIDSNITFNSNSGYIVNHTLKKICGPYKNIQKSIDNAFKVCFKSNKRTSLADLIVHKDSYVTQYNIPEYTHVTISGRETTRRYKTDNQDIFLSSAGVYCIENEKLNLIYVGETIVSFHKRWTDHYTKASTKRLKTLIIHPNTKFRILEITERDKRVTESKELYYIELLKTNTTYEVLGGNFADNRKRKR